MVFHEFSLKVAGSGGGMEDPLFRTKALQKFSLYFAEVFGLAI